MALFYSGPGLGAGLRDGQAATRQPDAFYLKLLDDGVRAYHDRNYLEAVKSLSVSSFGLVPDKALLGKALGYLSLSYFNLKEDAQAKDALLRLIELVGRENLSGLSMDDPDRTHLAQVLTFYKLDKPTAGPSSAPARVDTLAAPRPTGAGPKKETPADTVRALEKMVKDDPQNVQAYLDLYEFQIKQKNPKAARRALEGLVKKVPADPTGPFLLGKMRYAEKDFKGAVGYLEKTLALKKTAPAADPVSVESDAYLILSYNALKKKAETEKSCLDFLGRVGPEAVASLDLSDKDKDLLLGLLDRSQKSPAAKPAEEVAPAAEAAAPDPARIQKEIKQNPKDVSLYYGLYDLYRQKKDRSSAKQTLQNLVASNPTEAKGLLLLGKLCYEDKDFGRASASLRKVMDLPSTAPADDKLRGEAAFYLALSDYQNKDKDQALATYNTSARLLQEFVTSGAELSDSDRIVWQNIRSAAEASPLIYITDVRFERTAVGLEMKLALSGPTTYRTFVLPRERSIIIEVFHVAGVQTPELTEVNAQGIKAVRIAMYQKDTARVTLECLSRVPSHRLSKSDQGLSLVIE